MARQINRQFIIAAVVDPDNAAQARGDRGRLPGIYDWRFFNRSGKGIKINLFKICVIHKLIVQKYNWLFWILWGLCIEFREFPRKKFVLIRVNLLPKQIKNYLPHQIPKTLKIIQFVSIFPAVPDRRPRRPHQLQHRHQRVPRGRRGRRGTAQERRRRDVPRQAARSQQLPALCAGHARAGRRAARPRARAGTVPTRPTGACRSTRTSARAGPA